MFKKSFITDCEGPLTLNDNAFELSKYFIDDGANLFRTLSLYDDFLVDIVKKENYKAGNTLKLILPFFALRIGASGEGVITFKKVDQADFTYQCGGSDVRTPITTI